MPEDSLPPNIDGWLFSGCIPWTKNADSLSFNNNLPLFVERSDRFLEHVLADTEKRFDISRCAVVGSSYKAAAMVKAIQNDLSGIAGLIARLQVQAGIEQAILPDPPDIAGHSFPAP